MSRRIWGGGWRGRKRKREEEEGMRRIEGEGVNRVNTVGVLEEKMGESGVRVELEKNREGKNRREQR